VTDPVPDGGGFAAPGLVMLRVTLKVPTTTTSSGQW